jgi:beta-lactamase regulating signal transducer with metallopeptidase domain
MNPALVWNLAGWTIVHFAWMGCALLLIAATLRWLTSQSPAAVRYGMSLAALVLLAGAPVAIGGWLWWNAVPPIAELGAANRVPVAAPIPLAAELQEVAAPRVIDLAVEDYTPPLDREPSSASRSPEPPMVELSAEQIAGALDIDELTAWQRAEAALSVVTGWLPWLWVAGTPAMVVLLCGGLTVTGRLRRSARAIERPELLELFDRARQTLSVARHVTLAVSDRVRTPILVGIVRPLILLPPAVLTGWNAEQIELALLHELAHVRRHDNLVNLLQRVVEAALWFHPAVWIVSRWVRRDREECCDHLVVQHSGRPHDYARLLVDVASDYASTRQPILASAMARGSLHHRVRRILNLPEEPMKVSRMSLLIALALAGAIAVGSFVVPGWSNADEATPPASEETAIEQSIDDDSEVEETADESSAAASKVADEEKLFEFPTLEEQRLRDVVHSLLQFEPEPIDDEQQAICRDNKFAGGVLISRYSQIGVFQQGDILVGLHVWPTPTIEKLVEVLHRDDLLDLQPLKYYVLRPVQIAENVPVEDSESYDRGEYGGDEYGDEFGGGAGGGAMGGGRGGGGFARPMQTVTRTKWKLITGRVSINREAWRAEQQRQDAAAPATTEKDPLVKSAATVELTNMAAKLAAAAALDELGIEHRLASELGAAKVEGEYQLAEGELAIEVDQRTNMVVLRGPEGTVLKAVAIIKRLDAQQPTRQSGDESPMRDSPPETFPEPAFSAPPSSDPFAPAATDPFAFSAEPQGTGEVELRYDGKTFDEWSAYWRTELKVENRMEAIKAFMAFAQAGMAERALDAIFAVAESKDWQAERSQLEPAILAAITNSHAFDGNLVWQALLSRIEQDERKWSSLANNFINGAFEPTDVTIDGVKQLMHSESESLRKLGVRAAYAFNQDYQNSAFNKVLVDALNSNDDAIRREPLRYGLIQNLLASDAIESEVKEEIVADLLHLAVTGDAAERLFSLQKLHRFPEEWQAYALEVVLSRSGDALKPTDSYTNEGIEKLKRLLFVIAAFEKIADEALVEKTAAVLRPIVLDEQIDIDTATLAAVAAAIVADDINTNSGKFLHIESDELGQTRATVAKSPYAEDWLKQRTLESIDRESPGYQSMIYANQTRIRLLLSDHGEGSLRQAR